MAPFLRRDSEATLAELYARGAAHLDKIPSEAWREFDKSLERFISEEILKEDEAQIRGELKEQFGFASLGEEPMKMLRRIKRAGKIKTEDEAELVDHYLAGDFLGMFAGDLERRFFSDMARAYRETGLARNQ